MTPTYCGLVSNMIYATLNLLLGLTYTSRWFLAMGAYYGYIGLMRLAVVSHEKSAQRNDRSLLRSIGTAVIVLGVILAGVVAWTAEEHRTSP